MKLDMKADIDKEVKALKTLREELRKAAFQAVDKEASKSIEPLKTRLKAIVQSRTISSASENRVTTTGKKDDFSIPKSRADLIKEVLGEDIEDSNLFRAKKGNAQTNDGSNVFFSRDGIMKVRQSITDSSTLEGELRRFRDRVKNGVLIDGDTGKMFIVPSDAEAEIDANAKVECSTETGQTLDSERQFENWKNSRNNVQRHKTTYGRSVQLTLKRDSVRRLLAKSVPLDHVLDLIEDGKYSEAQTFLSRISKNGKFKDAVAVIEDMKTDGKSLSPDVQNLNSIYKLINNLRIKKVELKNRVDYVLVLHSIP